MELSKKSKSRLEHVIDIVYILIILAGFYLFMRYAFWLVFPFVFAFLIAAALQRPMNFAQRKLKIKKSISSVVLVLLFYLLILLVIALVGMRLWAGASDFAAYLTRLAKGLPKLLPDIQTRIQEMAVFLPDSLETRFNTWLDGFVKRLLEGEFSSITSNIQLEWFRVPASGILATATKIPSAAIAVVITVVSTFFIAASYDKIVAFIKCQLKKSQKNALSVGKKIFFSSLGKLLRSYVIIIGVTFIELLLGLLLLRLVGVWDGKYLLSIAVITALVDILPILGTGSVLMPWAIYNFIMGNFGMGIGLVVMFAVITVVRQILEPKLIASNLGLPPIVTLAGMYIGLQLFGFAGMLIVPLLTILLKLLNDEGVIKLWKKPNA